MKPRKRKSEMDPDQEFYWPRITIIKTREGKFQQALVKHRKTTGPDGERVRIIKRFKTYGENK